MSEPSVFLSASEREFLVDLLKAILKNTRVEEHRILTTTLREHVLHKESLITGLLKKLGTAVE